LGVTNVKGTLVAPLVKLTLFDVKPAAPPTGAERNQPFVPQSITPVGYWPFRARFGFVRSSNVTVVAPATAVGVGVTLGVNVRVGVCVFVGVDVRVAVALGVGVWVAVG
jgi:hypothetical protein